MCNPFDCDPKWDGKSPLPCPECEPACSCGDPHCPGPATIKDQVKFIVLSLIVLTLLFVLLLKG